MASAIKSASREADKQPTDDVAKSQGWRDGLTRKQQRFVEEYLIDLNATQAAIRAGYSAKTAGQGGGQLLKNIQIAAAIDAALAENPGVTRTRIVDELAKIAFAQPRDFFEWGPDGVTLVDCSELTPDQTVAVAEIAERHSKYGKNISMKLSDKQAALEKLGRTLGMFTDRHEHVGKDGGPLVIELVKFTDAADKAPE